MRKEKAFVLVAGEAGESPLIGRLIARCEGCKMDMILSGRIRVTRKLATEFFPYGSLDNLVGQDVIGVVFEGVDAFQKVRTIAREDPDNIFGITLPVRFLLHMNQKDAKRMITVFREALNFWQ